MTTAAVETGRLAKLVRLIFGSDHDGEVIAAVAAAKRLLAASDLDAHWLADRLTAPSALPTPHRSNDEGDDRSAAWFAFHRRHFLSPKERAFVVNIVERSAPLSEKQRQWLNDILRPAGGGCDSMSAAAKQRLVDPVEAFRARCEARAYLFSIGELDLHEAVDVLQADAERTGLLELIGQDEVQRIMSDAFRPYRDSQR